MSLFAGTEGVRGLLSLVAPSPPFRRRLFFPLTWGKQSESWRRLAKSPTVSSFLRGKEEECSGSGSPTERRDACWALPPPELLGREQRGRKRKGAFPHLPGGFQHHQDLVRQAGVPGCLACGAKAHYTGLVQGNKGPQRGGLRPSLPRTSSCRFPPPIPKHGRGRDWRSEAAAHRPSSDLCRTRVTSPPPQDPRDRSRERQDLAQGPSKAGREGVMSLHWYCSRPPWLHRRGPPKKSEPTLPPSASPSAHH